VMGESRARTGSAAYRHTAHCSDNRYRREERQQQLQPGQMEPHQVNRRPVHVGVNKQDILSEG
jgi:hypothetical protein